MKQKYLRDQRGVAMLLELVLVAAVLALAGLAVYQANHRSSVANSTSAPKADSAQGIAETAAKIGTTDLTNDAAVSGAADVMASEANNAAEDVTTLGGTSNASF